MDIYQNLAQHLDRLPAGFPRTESGVELRILKRLFTPGEAELARHLTLIPEKPKVVARRAGIRCEDAERRLDVMVEKGLAFYVVHEDGTPQYQAIQFVVGFWEAQVNRLDQEFVRDMEEYWPAVFDLAAWEKTPQLRTVPVYESIDVPREVMSYEQAEELIRVHDTMGVAPCICRQEQKIKGQTCDRPEETCMQFGKLAEYYFRRGVARPIDRQEALGILKQANTLGLVLQPSNSREAAFLCCCCGCCCAVLRNIKRFPKPASLVSTPFTVMMRPEGCTGCGRCLHRCQMDALRMEADRAVVDAGRCIGCGLCVSTCPTHSLVLTRKPDSEQTKIPRNFRQTLIALGRKRGKLTPGGMLKMLAKSKIDRLLARGRHSAQ